MATRVLLRWPRPWITSSVTGRPPISSRIFIIRRLPGRSCSTLNKKNSFNATTRRRWKRLLKGCWKRPNVVYGSARTRIPLPRLNQTCSNCKANSNDLVPVHSHCRNGGREEVADIPRDRSAHRGYTLPRSSRLREEHISPFVRRSSAVSLYRDRAICRSPFGNDGGSLARFGQRRGPCRKEEVVRANRFD